MIAHDTPTAPASNGIGAAAPAAADTQHFEASSASEVTVPDAAFLANAQYVRHGADLYMADGAGRSIVVHGYFAAEPPPTLVTEDGARAATPELVEPFVVSSTAGQYAQLGAPASGPQIGQVSEMNGTVYAVRADGTRVELGTGAPLYQGDVVETAGEGSAVRILLVDQTTFALGPDARLALDELTYNPQDQSGEVSVSMLKGVFIFTSGLVAKKDPSQMTVNTPVALIGIRGTVVTGNLDDLGGQFTVLDGAIQVETNVGTVTLNESGATTQVTNINAPPASVFVLAPTEYAAIYKAVSNVAPGGYLRQDPPEERDDGTGDLGTTLPGESGDRGSVGQSVAALIGPALIGLGAFEALAQLPTLTNDLEDLLEELANDTPAEEEAVAEDEGLPDTPDEPGGGGGTAALFDFSASTGPVNFLGNDSDEIVLGSAFADNIDTQGGNDTVVGNNGEDTILGGAGNDLLNADNGGPGTVVEHDFVTTTAIPALSNGQAVSADQINGVDPADLTLQADNPVTVTFQSEGAGQQNSLGYYKIGPNGEITDVDFVWTNASAAGSGGTLQTGDSVALDVGAGDTFGFFLIADGAGENDFAGLQNGTFEFRDANGNPATTATNDPILVFIAADGTETVLEGDIFHATDPAQNGDGLEHAVSGVGDGVNQLIIGFEDLVGGGDNDFQDLVISVEIAPAESPGTDADIVDGGPGNDVLIGGSGDTLLGGDGDDLFQVADLTFAQIDGGTGTDTVQFTGPNASFDLTGLTQDQIGGIERIDLTAVDNATLTLSGDIVLALTDGVNALTGEENSLVIAGDEGDQVLAGDGWTETGSASIEGESYTVYQHDSGAEVAVDDQVGFA